MPGAYEARRRMHRMTLAAAVAMLCLSSALSGPIRAQKPGELPEPCGGSDRALAEFHLDQYRPVFFAADRQELRAELGVERLASGRTVEVVDRPELCTRLIRRVLDVLNDQAWEEPEQPSERIRRSGIRYTFFRYGPYLVALVTPPDDTDVSFTGHASVLVFRSGDLSFIGHFLG